MQAKPKSKILQDFNYIKAERIDGRVIYLKRCAHCNGKFECTKVSAVFCNEHCRKTYGRVRLHTGKTVVE